MSFKVNRREFLRFSSGGVAGLAAAGVTMKGISTLNAALDAEEIKVPRGPETWALGVCTLCPGGCGLRVRKIGERAVKIQGNPLHPVSHGGLCPRGLAGLQVLYHPERLRGPLENTGSRDNPIWQEISWEQATGKIVDRLRDIQTAGQAESVVFLAGQTGHLRQRLFKKFLTAYGSPNFLPSLSGLDSAQRATYLQQGVSEGLAYDLEHTRYLLSFGANLLEGWGSPVNTMRAFGHWRDSEGGRRAKCTQISPRFSLTAAKADEWVALKPGTEAALALGIAYVLITEGLYDTDFVNERTFGFEDWQDRRGKTHMGFRSLVLQEYRLNAVSALTDVPVETILRLAREFGHNRPAMAISGQTASTLPGNPYTAMAVNSLNALAGSIEADGGVVVRPSLPGDEDSIGKSLLQRDDSPFPMADLSHLPEAIRRGEPYTVQAVFVHGTDPVFSLPNGGQLAEALREVPFLVSFSPFMNETAAQADLILPDHTDLEKWQEAASPPTFPFPEQSISPPVVEPQYRTRDTADVLLEVAQALGGGAATALPHASAEEFLQEESTKIFAARAGYTFTTHLEDTWNRMLERSGWWAPTYSTENELWEEMKEKGGWWEPTYYFGEWDRVLRTPSRRFEFYSQRLAQFAAEHGEQVRAAGFDPGEDRYCLPHQPGLTAPPMEFPLLMVPVEVLPLAGGDGGHLPYLQQIAGQHVFEHWRSWLEMNPETAHELGLKDLEEVWVESRQGRARVRLRTYNGVRPGVVHLPLGYGATKGPEWARRGVNPLSLLEEHREPLTGLPQTDQTYVRVYQV
jgi:anaerobic selenocysteine-containing dehydrogenase